MLDFVPCTLCHLAPFLYYNDILVKVAYFPTRRHDRDTVATKEDGAKENRPLAAVQDYLFSTLRVRPKLVIHILYNRTWFISQFRRELSSSPPWLSG